MDQGLFSNHDIYIGFVEFKLRKCPKGLSSISCFLSHLVESCKIRNSNLIPCFSPVEVEFKIISYQNFHISFPKAREQFLCKMYTRINMNNLISKNHAILQ